MLASEVYETPLPIAAKRSTDGIKAARNNFTGGQSGIRTGLIQEESKNGVFDRVREPAA